MATTYKTTGKTTATKKSTTSTTTKCYGSVRKATELLVVTKAASNSYASVTVPLAKNNINTECFTAYVWGNETAFRMVTSNNKKAYELLKNAGYNVSENTVALWCTDNEPGVFNKAATALAKANISTYCSYSTSVPNSNATVIAFNTNDTNGTIDVLSRIC